MVPQVVRNGPNTHVIIDTNPPINRPVSWSRSISTVGLVPPMGQHDWYWWSVRLHLRRITVDRWSSIIDQDNFVIGWTDDTCANFVFNKVVPSWIWTKLFRHGNAKVGGKGTATRWGCRTKQKWLQESVEGTWQSIRTSTCTELRLLCPPHLARTSVWGCACIFLFCDM